MKIKRELRIYLYSFCFFCFFASLIVISFISKENELKTKIIESDQIVYAKIVNNYIEKNHLQPDNLNKLSDLSFLFPENIHLTVLNKKGDLLFDQFALNENFEQKKNIKFLYYKKLKKDYIIRIGFPYTSEIKDFLKPNLMYIVFIILLFILGFLFLSFVYNSFSYSIKKMKYYLTCFRRDETFPSHISFADEKLSEIQALIVEICNQLELNKKGILLEREKLLEHFHFAEEGISFFTPSFENIYTNSHFIQYLNILLNQTTFDVNILFTSPVFGKFVKFLKNPEKKNTFSKKLHANGRHFFVQVILFDDKSFEIIIRDISGIEENDFDKTAMTNNIAHELRTPVTGVRGYLETLIEHKNLPPEKKDEYMQRAYAQIVRLSDIIQDITLLSKTKEAPQYFTTEDVNIHEMLRDLIEIDLKEAIEKNKSTVNIQVSEKVIIKGNRTLLYSIFGNLVNNALKHAGENTAITIHNYMEDDNYYYFSVSDNGTGIEEKHLKSIFERFYRINEGRTRDKGSSGLGLPIVKDAVNFHKGEILAKNKTGGGLEFLFTLRKK
ncbi:MAG: HAMP domain-containing histidine kinase [Dysgonamonadaceae bacterium]|jgi:signal transduction histidine kinase|nr:HAMP domain-containing histidine kinase [Dysgonamonadaceae bacterium]